MGGRKLETGMAKSSYKVRSAGFADALAIFAMVKDNPDELLPRPISDIRQNIDRFIVAEDDGRIIGTVAWQILPEIGVARTPSVEIKSLAVAEDSRKLGIGRALVLAAIERIKPLCPSEIIVLTFHSGFFRKMGFGRVRKESLMHKLYAGCVNCAKYDSPFTCPEVAMRLRLQTPDGDRSGTKGDR